MSADQDQDQTLLNIATNPSPFKFSNDILMLILERVDDTETLIALSVSSKLFHSLVEPILYSVVDFPNSYIEVSAGDGFVRGFPRLLRSILKTPSLGRRVKALYSIFNHELVLPNDIQHTFNDTDLERLRNAIEWTLGSDDLEWNFTEARNGNWDILFSVLLCHLPNIEELQIPRINDNDSQFSGPNKCLEMVLDRAAKLQETLQLQDNTDGIGEYEDVPVHESLSTDEPSVQASALMTFPLSKLSKVTLNPWSCSDGTDLMYTLPFLSVPSIKHFSVHVQEWGSFDLANPQQNYPTTIYKFPYPNFSFGATSLFLQASPHKVVEYDYLQFLPLFRCLKALRYKRHDSGEITIVENEAVIDGLTNSSEHLEFLEISDWVEKCRDSLSSLARFPRLKFVIADAWIFVGPYCDTDCLLYMFPESLQALTLRKSNPKSLKALTRMLEENAPPNLQQVTIEMSTLGGVHKEYIDDFRDSICALGEQASQLGVKVGLLRVHRDTKRQWDEELGNCISTLEEQVSQHGVDLVSSEPQLWDEHLYFG